MEIKPGDFFLWYEDDINWGIDQLVHFHRDGGIYETTNGSGISDTHVIGKVDLKHCKLWQSPKPRKIVKL